MVTRPITCLNTSYKLLTALMARILMKHAMEVGALPREQKALRKGSRGCLDALTIDEAISEEVRVLRRNLEVGWIDYQKAYDRVPHE